MVSAILVGLAVAANAVEIPSYIDCLLYTSDAADD